MSEENGKEPDEGLELTSFAAGAMSFTRHVEREGKDNQIVADAFNMFADMSTHSELGELVKKAGFPQYPDEATPAERVEIATRFVGAPPTLDDPTDLKGSLSLALVAMSWAMDRKAESLAGTRHLGPLMYYALMQGQIAMWWRWRSEGHDKLAVSRVRSNKGLEKAHAVIAEDRMWNADVEWWDEAREIATRYRLRKPGTSKSEVARHVLKELQTFDPSFSRSLRQITRKI